MSIERTHEAVPPPPDQTSFRQAESGAQNAWQGELHPAHLLQHHLVHHHLLQHHEPHHVEHHFAHPTAGHLHRPVEHHPHLPAMEIRGSDNSAEAQTSIGYDLTGRIVRAIGTNEGALTRITRNDNGHGISVGIRQWNQEGGELPDLLRSMHDKDAGKFKNIFGPYSNELMRESWVRHADMAGNPDLMRRMSAALRDPEFQQVQVDKAREFANTSIETARQYGLQTEQGAALVADITNQLGAGGARRVFAEAGLRPGGTVKNEKAILQRMEHLTQRPNSRERFNTIASTFGNGALIHRQQVLNDMTYLG